MDMVWKAFSVSLINTKGTLVSIIMTKIIHSIPSSFSKEYNLKIIDYFIFFNLMTFRFFSWICAIMASWQDKNVHNDWTSVFPYPFCKSKFTPVISTIPADGLRFIFGYFKLRLFYFYIKTGRTFLHFLHLYVTFTAVIYSDFIYLSHSYVNLRLHFRFYFYIIKYINETNYPRKFL